MSYKAPFGTARYMNKLQSIRMRSQNSLLIATIVLPESTGLLRLSSMAAKLLHVSSRQHSETLWIFHRRLLRLAGAWRIGHFGFLTKPEYSFWFLQYRLLAPWLKIRCAPAKNCNINQFANTLLGIGGEHTFPETLRADSWPCCDKSTSEVSL